MTQPLHVIVCGGRDFIPRADDGTRLCAWLHAVVPVVLHHGDARGADRWAAGLASRMDGVTVRAYPADWQKYGVVAGTRRNLKMLQTVLEIAVRKPIVIAYPGGKGTAHMVKIAKHRGCKVLHPHG